MQNNQYNKCRSWWVDQTWYSWLFQLRPSRVSKTSLEPSKFKNSKFESNFVKWEVDQNNKCRSWWAWQNWYWWLLYLKPFRVLKTGVKVLFFKIEIWLGQTWSNETLNDLRWKTFKYIGDRTNQDLYYLYRSGFHLRSFRNSKIFTKLMFLFSDLKK
jgi:hypothetical protein